MEPSSTITSIADNVNFSELVRQAYQEMGNVNIVIAGKTGVGKTATKAAGTFAGNLVSSLVGSLFD